MLRWLRLAAIATVILSMIGLGVFSGLFLVANAGWVGVAIPRWLQIFAPALPTYHLSQLMLSVFGYQDEASLASHWMGLAGFTMLMLGLGWLVFNRSQQSA